MNRQRNQCQVERFKRLTGNRAIMAFNMQKAMIDSGQLYCVSFDWTVTLGKRNEPHNCSACY
jgi:hypothetical protein